MPTFIPSPPSQAPHTPRAPSKPSPPPTHLILLTCHSIYISGPPTSPTSWLLAPFQKSGNEHLTFLTHITLASSLLSSDPNALLVISGGYTRREICKSEARGYFEVGVERGLWGEGEISRSGSGSEGRIILEEGALDSFGNLLRGLLAFWRGTGRGRWPGKVSIVSHGFKGERFLGLHCRALGIGCWRGGGEVEKEEEKEGGERRGGVEVVFLGRNPSFMDPGSAEFDKGKCEDTIRGERERGYEEWKEDLWGTGKRLRGKRGMRDAWGGGMENGVGGGKEKGRPLFESEEERVKSGVRTRWLEEEEGMVREEVILEGVDMPWEGER